jgi:hypothetical protein
MIRRPTRRQLLAFFAALTVLLVGIGLYAARPLFYPLRCLAQNWLAPEPSVVLEFNRDPADVPVLSSGTDDTPMIVMDPCAIKDAEGYHLFFSSFFCETPTGLAISWDPGAGNPNDIANLTTAIAYAFSPDQGRTWTVRPTPVLLPGEAEWEDHRIETASTVVVGDTLHLFYSADGHRDGELFAARYQIGAVSLYLAGTTIREAFMDREAVFARQRDEPILPGVTDRHSFRNNVQEPSILRVGDHFELYFVGLGLAHPNEAIDYPEQETRPVGLGRAILDDAFEVIEVSDSALVDLAIIIEVRKIGDTYLLFSTLPGDGEVHQGERIGYFTSEDGLRWSRKCPILVGEQGPDFDRWAAMSPTVVPESDQLVVFYTALSGAPEPPEGRWGIPLPENRRLYGTLGRAVAPAPPELFEITATRK